MPGPRSILRDSARRLGRLRPSRIQPSVRVLVFASLATTLAFAVAIIVPGAIEDTDPFAAVLGMPVWFALLICLAGWLASLAGIALAAIAAYRRSPEAVVAITVVSGIGVTLPWGVLAVRVDDTGGVLDDLVIWLTITAFAFSFTLIGAFYGVARVAQERHELFSRLLPGNLPAWGAALAVVLGIAIVIARLTVARDLFSADDASIWGLGQWYAWPHAFLVAGVIAWAAWRSRTAPLRSFGEQAVLWVLVVGGMLDYFLFPLLTPALTLGADGDPVVEAIKTFPFATPWVRVAIIVALAVAVALPAFRASAGRLMGVVAVVLLALPLLSVALGGADVIPPIWASATQVATALVAIAGGMLVWSLARASSSVHPDLIVRLVLIPLVAVHAGGLVPAALSTVVGGVLVALGALAAVFLLLPPVAADPLRHSRVVLGATTLQLLVVAAFAVALPTITNGDLTTSSAVLWLSMPVAATLCARVSRDSAN